MKYQYALIGILLLIHYEALPQTDDVYASKRETSSEKKVIAAPCSLKQSLKDLERSLNVSIAYKDEWVENKMVEPSKGKFNTVEDGLKTLLKNTGLYFEKAGDNFYVIYERAGDNAPGSLQSASVSTVPLVAGPLAKSTAQQDPLSLYAEVEKSDVAVDVSGRVTDEDGNPFPGVNVLVKGTSSGTSTNADGRYTLSVDDPNAILVYSFVGYSTQEVALGGRSVLDISMVPDVKSLEEVVVTALGIKKESKKLGYATSTVRAEDLTVNRTVNIGNSLQGKVAGLNVSPVSTGPGGTSKIRIRGASSFKGNNSPLIIVNGVPVNNTNFSSKGPSGRDSEGTSTRGDSFSDTGDGLLSVNPDDIESITVLKGATAAALYGFRAKDGAIVITTKTGARNKGIGIEVNSNLVMDRAIDQTEFQYEYGQGENGVRPVDLASAQSTGVWSFGERFDGAPTIQFDGSERPYSPVKNRINKFFETGYTWSNTVSLSGGNSSGNFNLSLSNLHNKSIMPNSGFDRKSVNLGLNHNLTEKLLVNANVNYSHEDIKNPPNVLSQIYNANTTLYTLANSIPFDILEHARKEANGDERATSRFATRNNPYWMAYDRFENAVRDRIFGNISLRYDLFDWLYIQGRLGQDYFTRSNDYNVPTGTRGLGAVTTGFNGQYYQEAGKFRETNLDFLIGTHHALGSFGLNVMLGGNSMIQTSDINSVKVDNFFIKDLYTVQNGIIKDPQYVYNEKRVNSLYGAAEISYKDFLFVNLTARNDWFSALNPESNSYLYPSVSTSFVFTETLASLPSWLSFGKLRAAYAEVGGDTDPYKGNLYYALRANPHLGQPLGIVKGSTSPNPHLSPLKVKEFELGLEARLFQDKVSVDIAYYDKKTVDEILPVDISNATGFTSQLVNVGELRNRGIEALVNITPVERDNFTWDLSVNGSYNTSEVLKLAGDQQKIQVGTGEFIGLLAHEVGKPMASLQVVTFDRAPDGQIIHVGGAISPGAVKTLGSAMPKWVGGITNSFTYKGFRLSALIDFKLGHKLVSNTNFNLWRHGLHKGTLAGREEGVIVGDGVKADPDNPGQFIPNDVSLRVQDYYNLRNGNIGEPFVYNAGFVKFRQLTLGYDFTRFLKQGWVIRGLSVNLVVNNLAVLKKYTPNIDPEMVTGASDNLQGLENGGMPITRSYGMNLNLKL